MTSTPLPEQGESIGITLEHSKTGTYFGESGFSSTLSEQGGEYVIFRSEYMPAIASSVNEALSQGGSLVGGISRDTYGNYHQAMLIPKEGTHGTK